MFTFNFHLNVYFKDSFPFLPESFTFNVNLKVSLSIFYLRCYFQFDRWMSLTQGDGMICAVSNVLGDNPTFNQVPLSIYNYMLV